MATNHYGHVLDHRNRKRWLVVLTDYLSKYFDIAVVMSTSAIHNIPIYNRIFKTNGYPQRLISDNGPPFNGKDTSIFQRYMRWAGVDHQPTYSANEARANGLAEVQMKAIKKVWDAALLLIWLSSVGTHRPKTTRSTRSGSRLSKLSRNRRSSMKKSETSKRTI